VTGDRRLLVEIRGGPLALRRAVVAPGSALRVGRTSLADLVVPHDEQMSQVHCEIRWDGARCEVRDAGSATGTQLGGQRIDVAEARSGSWIRAGATDLLVYFEHVAPPGAPRGPYGALREIASRGQLFALLDAARSDRALSILQTSADEYASLYEGLQSETLADEAPYLVRLDAESRLLPRLLDEGWGESWGIYVEAPSSLRELRGHLRRLLYVMNEQDGQPMYFRFYDPRVLRAFLPIATPRQVEEIFGPIERFLVEAEDPGAALRFERGPSASGVACERL
jgi:hypothetical protein